MTDADRWRRVAEICHAALERVQRAGGTGRTLVGLTSPGKRCPRQGYKLLAGGQQIGQICSGNISPTLDTNIATAYVRTAFAAPGTQAGSTTFGIISAQQNTPRELQVALKIIF